MAEMSTSTIDPVSATARWTAAVRARESDRDDRLFHDPWAWSLAGEVGARWIAERSEDSTAPIAIRTRYFDDWLRACVADPGIRQVVLLAAGLDTRAYRLDWPPETRMFELDQGPVLDHKAACLDAARAEPRCARYPIAADLSAPWLDSLVGAGFDVARPAAWLLEGFLFYLPSPVVEGILDTVGSLSAPGSRLGFDIVNGLVLTSPWTRAWIEMQATAGAPWIGTMDDPVGFLADRGWTAHLSQPGAPEASYGRWTLPVIPPTMPDMPHSWYVTADR